MNSASMLSVLERAIKNEEDAYNFYTNLAGMVQDSVAREALQFLAGEEKRHREFLLDYISGKVTLAALPMEHVVDYQIAQYVDKPDIEKDLSTSEIYLVAAHREWNAHKFYLGLAALQPDGEIKTLLNEFAKQELRHKEKVEYLYSNTSFPQTAGG